MRLPNNRSRKGLSGRVPGRLPGLGLGLALVLWLTAGSAVAAAATGGNATPVPRRVGLWVDRGGSITVFVFSPDHGAFLEGSEAVLTSLHVQASGTGFDAVCREVREAAVLDQAQPGPQPAARPGGEPEEQQDITLELADALGTSLARFASPASTPAAMIALMDRLVARGQGWPQAAPGIYAVATDADRPLQAGLALTGRPLTRAEVLRGQGVTFPEVTATELNPFPGLAAAVALPGYPGLLPPGGRLPPAMAMDHDGSAGITVAGRHLLIRCWTWPPPTP